jgi:hypothetical protein
MLRILQKKIGESEADDQKAGYFGNVNQQVSISFIEDLILALLLLPFHSLIFGSLTD